MICRYFHTQSVAYHFFLLQVYFEEQNFFIVVNPNYFFSLIDNSLLKPRLQTFTPIFSYRVIIILDFHLRL